MGWTWKRRKHDGPVSKWWLVNQQHRQDGNMVNWQMKAVEGAVFADTDVLYVIDCPHLIQLLMVVVL